MADSSSNPYIIESSAQAYSRSQWLSKSGIPFAIEIPSLCYETGDGRSNGQINWVLEVSAPLADINYYAAFPLEVVAPEHAALIRRDMAEDELEDQVMPG